MSSVSMGSCASCGRPKDPVSAFCVHCGAAATSHSAQGSTGAAQPPPPRKGGFSASGASMASLTQRGFFRSLFDISFTSFVTTKIIKVIYAIWMVIVALGTLAFVLIAFKANGALGVLVLFIIGPIGALFALIYGRVILELVIASLRVAENTTELVVLERRRPFA